MLGVVLGMLGALAGLGVGLGVGFGCAGRAGWVGPGVGRGVWPCWAFYLRKKVTGHVGGRAGPGWARIWLC